jgi:hypothetical protein
MVAAVEVARGFIQDALRQWSQAVGAAVLEGPAKQVRGMPCIRLEFKLHAAEFQMLNTHGV